MKNPPWTRDELILALDLYFQEPAARGSKTHPAVIALSEVLNALPIHADVQPGESFRNPSGVGMKLSNFLRYDPDYTGKGLERGSKLEEEIWEEFVDRKSELHKVAQAIRDNYAELGPVSPEQTTEDEAEAEEGRVLTRVHRLRERDSSIVKKKKQAILQKEGALRCEACGFDFAVTYGELGEGFAECHHEKPVSELNPGEKTRLDDLRIVCANCHRMIHRTRPWLSVASLREKFLD